MHLLNIIIITIVLIELYINTFLNYKKLKTISSVPQVSHYGQFTAVIYGCRKNRIYKLQCAFNEFGHSSLSSVEPGKSYGKGRVSTIDLLSKVVWFVKIGK